MRRRARERRREARPSRAGARGRRVSGAAAAMAGVLLAAGAAWAQAPGAGPGPAGAMAGASAPTEAAAGGGGTSALGSGAGAEAALAGGVARGRATAGVLRLSLDEAIARGLRANLAMLLSSSATQAARGERWRALAAMLPRVTATASDEETKENLAAFGFSFPGFPQIVGPFRVFDARAYLHETVLNGGDLETWRAAKAEETAAAHTFQETRDLVVLAVGNQYLQAVADRSRVASAEAELTTATQARQQAEDMHAAGTVNGLDVVRAQVEEDQRRQNLIAQRDALATQKLALARAIGLPAGQEFVVAATIPYAPPPAVGAAAAVAGALARRPDYAAALERERAAKLRLEAAHLQRLPSLNFDANYGTIGQALTENHPTFTLAGSVSVPVFLGGSLHGEALAAEAEMRQAEAQAGDLRAQIENQVRTALLEMNAANDQVQVAGHGLGLARQELTLARDRFRAGVADNLEEVQAEQAVAVAEENYTASLYAYNAAKLALAQARGVAEAEYRDYLNPAGAARPAAARATSGGDGAEGDQ